MTQQRDSKGELMAANSKREFTKVKPGFQTSTTGVFTQVTLTVVFMYLIVISYSTLGIGGPVFISVLFIVALFFPYLYQRLSVLLKRRKQTKEVPSLDSEAPQEG